MIVVIIMTIVVILIIIGNNTNALELGLAYCQTASNGNIILQNGVGPGHVSSTGLVGLRGPTLGTLPK